MTTIVADASQGVMVSDTRCSYGNTTFQFRKVYELPDGTLVGCAGNSEPAQLFIQWLANGQPADDKPTFDEDDSFDALVLGPDGLALWSQRLIGLKILNGIYAVGSGGQYALGAMRAGASMEQAVEIAILEDRNSGYPVEQFVYTAKKVRKAPKKTSLLSD